MSNHKPIIGITIGDPAGIGPEIVLKALQNEFIYQQARPLVIGSYRVLEAIMQTITEKPVLHRIRDAAEATYQWGHVDILDIDNVNVENLQMGVVQAECGQACFEYIVKAVELGRANQIDVIATAPINKEALRAADVPYIGHTEMVAELFGVEKVMTMFAVEAVRIFFLTRHLSLIDACRKLADPNVVYDGIMQAYAALRELVGHEPLLAVAGLNPHSGEGGLLGREEIESLRPAIERAKAQGLQVVGPVPADSVFHFARKGLYDAVLSLYHDQGHIAAKMIDFEKTVSFTLGLPTLRTSVDHGTAYDIAGRGQASPVSMVEALKAAYASTRH